MRGILVFPSSSGGGGGGTITNIANEGSGTGLFDAIVGTTANFKTLVAGTGITITPASTTVTISSSGFSNEIHGSFASPIAVGTTFTPSAAAYQTWFVNTAGGTVNTTIAGGTLGQILVIKGTDPSNYPIIANAAGTNQNGSVSLNNNNTISYTHNGTVWDEDDRRA